MTPSGGYDTGGNARATPRPGREVLPFELYVPEHVAQKPIPLTAAERLLVDRLVETEQRASAAEKRAAQLEEALRWATLHLGAVENEARAMIDGLLG